jgi:biopolymer transport protein ExbB
MNIFEGLLQRSARRVLPLGWAFLSLAALASLPLRSAAAEEVAPPPPAAGQTQPVVKPAPAAGEDPAAVKARLAEADRRAEADTAEAKKVAQTAQQPAGPQETPRINFLELTLAGGPLMIPIGLMSLLALTFVVERWLALRRSKVMPPELIEGLGRLAGQPGGLDPRAAYRLCQQFPSAAANVIRSMLLKVGRPHSELEHAVAEAGNREAARLYANVRWLNLSATVAPLLGLLGTVQGMIMAFFTTANLPTGANKAQELAKGIYIALVTTFAGLCVAIPAAIMAHYFETRLEKLFRELDETLSGVLPQLERFEGRLRVNRDQLDRLTADPSAPDSPAHSQPAVTPK